MSIRASAVLCCSLILFPGCAYYNGMYNAKRFAKQAERSERLGRANEAADRWRIAAMHAESVVTRHPRSRWADDAELLRARALVHLEAWSEAAVAAERALTMAGDQAHRREAYLYLGLAQSGLRRTSDAVASLDSALATDDARLRSAALLARGRARLALRMPGEALLDFRGSVEEDAAFERAHAALASGDARLAAIYADSLVLRQPFHEAQWLMLLDSLSRSGLASRASGFTDAIRSRADVRAGPKARLLLADGDRLLAAGNDSLAAERYREVQRIAGDSVEARAAEVRLVKLGIGASHGDADFDPVRQRLRTIVALGGTPAQDAREVLRLLDLADSLGQRTATPDAWWFLRAELLRDSLGSRTLAGDAFADMPARFPSSPWTPKAILAAIALGHPAADSLRGVLLTRYADSPYTRAVSGSDDLPERFAALEDSLFTALADRPMGRPATVVGQPGPQQDDDVGRRPAAPPPRPVVRPGTRPSTDP